MPDVIGIIVWIIVLFTLVTANPDISSKGKQLRILGSQSDGSNDVGMPRFAEPIPNVTVSVGRDALLACVIENLKGYKVAWVRVDTQTILSIHHNVITQNPRISLSYNDHRSWYLHIKEVEENDRGWYMCQVNTDPMRSKKGYLQVVVPPMIIEGVTSNDMVIREGTNVTLMCKARGYPEPYVMWRREDGEEMQIGGENVNVVDGEILHITKVSRLHMAAYLCVASNGVPPSISKRVHLRVQFPPMLSIPNQLEGAYIGQDVILECHTEAYPASINYWTTERGDMIISDTSRAGEKYETTSTTNGYSKYMKLKIRNIGPTDFGSYRCVAKNSLGETDGVIKLDEILAPTTTVMSDIVTYNRSFGKRPHRKYESNALPDYGAEEWRNESDMNQPSIRHPPGTFHNKATSVSFISSSSSSSSASSSILSSSSSSSSTSSTSSLLLFGCEIYLPSSILCWLINIFNEFIYFITNISIKYFNNIFKILFNFYRNHNDIVNHNNNNNNNNINNNNNSYNYNIRYNNYSNKNKNNNNNNKDKDINNLNLNLMYTSVNNNYNNNNIIEFLQNVKMKLLLLLLYQQNIFYMIFSYMISINLLKRILLK